MKATLIAKGKPNGFFHNIEKRELLPLNTIRSSERYTITHTGYEKVLNMVTDILMVNTDKKE